MPSPAPSSRSRREGVWVSVVSAGFVLLGVALRDRVPWYVTGFFVACLLAGILGMLGILHYDRVSDERLTIDDAGITRTAPRLREHVAWDDIGRVRIVTTDRGPIPEDVFFVIDSKHGSGCVVAHDLAVRGGLLEALQARLPGVNNEAVIAAMVSVENRTFTIWEAPGDA